MIRPKLVETVIAGEIVARDEKFEALYPNLWEALTRLKGESGNVRQRHSLFIVHEDGCFRVCVRDRQEGCEAWFACVNLSDALGLVEVAVGTGEGPWRLTHQVPAKKKAQKRLS